MSFFSKRHELHFLTAFRIFKDFPIIGGGINSFRHLCKIEPYSVKDIILNDPDNKVLAPFNGYFYLIKNVLEINKENYDRVVFIKSGMNNKRTHFN
jgi:hypothetical protein